MRNLLILLVVSLLFPTAGFAQFPTPPTNSGEECDFTEFKNSLFQTESRGSGGYTAVNGICATGMYQFMPGTARMLGTYNNAPPACSIDACQRNVGLASGSNECNQVQEDMLDEFALNNLILLQENCPAAVAAIEAGAAGPDFQGYKIDGNGNRTLGEPCKLSWSGLLAGAHIAGAGDGGPGSGVCKAVTNMSDWDDSDPPNRVAGTSVQYYICRHKDLPIPSADCDPSSYPANAVIDGWNGRTAPPARPDSAYLSRFLKDYWIGGLQLMTNQLTSVMMMQVQAIGKFFDVKHQLETQRIMQQKYARAHKDYHPSEQMCEIGTFSRDLLNSEQRAELTHTAITEKMMSRGLGSGDGLTTDDNTSDKKGRLEQYIDTFCNIEDNARNNALLCNNASGDADQQNIDIDFTRLIDAPLTLPIDLSTTAVNPGSPTADEVQEEKTETNIFAFLNYIFLHDTLPTTGRSKTTLEKFVIPYQDARSLMAMRSVAHNSFAALIAMKTAGSKIPPGGTGEESTSPYLKALMREMGMDDNEITDFLGTNPSYYAQMEILTKKMYQNPEFVANLYDKPANVRRIRAAMTAIKLMQDRDIHEAMMRREMLISMILELKLREKQHRLTDEINNMVGRYSQP